MEGLSNVLRNLNREIDKVKQRTIAGLTEAALVVKYDSVKNTPVEWGNLRGSCFILVTGGSPDPPSPTLPGPDTDDLIINHAQVQAQMKAEVQTGMSGLTGGLPDKLRAVVAYGAAYAMYVHEMPGHYNFNSGSNKFLERALEKNHKRVLKILKKHARIK